MPISYFHSQNNNQHNSCDACITSWHPKDSMGSCKDPLNIRVFLSLLWETGLNLEMSKLSSQTLTEVIVSFTSHLFFIFVYKIFFFFTMSNHLFFRERLCMDIVSLILRFNDGVIDQSQSQALILFTCSSFPGSE